MHLVILRGGVRVGVSVGRGLLLILVLIGRRPGGFRGAVTRLLVGDVVGVGDGRARLASLSSPFPFLRVHLLVLSPLAFLLLLQIINTAKVLRRSTQGLNFMSHQKHRNDTQSINYKFNHYD